MSFELRRGTEEETNLGIRSIELNDVSRSPRKRERGGDAGEEEREKGK